MPRSGRMKKKAPSVGATRQGPIMGGPLLPAGSIVASAARLASRALKPAAIPKSAAPIGPLTKASQVSAGPVAAYQPKDTSAKPRTVRVQKKVR